MRALLSVYDKTGVVDFARGLEALGFELFSTGGTESLLRESGVRVRGVQEQVQDDLLKLDTVTPDKREIVGKFRPQNHPVTLKLTR